MKKGIIIGIIIVIIIAVVLILFNPFAKKNYVILKTNGGVPYKWEYTIENLNVIKFDEMVSTSKNKNITGGEILEKYIFKGLKKGETTITFEYKNFTDGTVDQTKVYKVTVNKNLKVKIKEKH